MNYFSGNYDGYLDAKLKQNFGGADLMNLALDWVSFYRCDITKLIKLLQMNNFKDYFIIL